MFFKTIEELKSKVESTGTKPEEQLMILVAEGSAPYLNELMDYLNSKNISFFGGIYARLMVGDESLEQGFVVQVLEPIYSTLVLPYMMRFRLEPESLKNSTAIVLADGLSSKLKVLTDTLYGKVGKHVTYVGGGAGFYSLEHKPCIFDNRGIYKDVLYVCIIASDVKVAVKHGWNKLQGPFFVKESRENVLCMLEDDNAFDLYKHVIEEEERITLYKQDFFLFAKDHPFGILQEDGSLVVRDPIAVDENGHIVCVADIPEGSDLYVLKGDINTLLSASLQIAEYCSENAPKEYIPLLFNCISRAMFMEERFREELRNIQKQLRYGMEGALSIGEFASRRNGELVIHNKSTVLALLHKDNS